MCLLAACLAVVAVAMASPVPDPDPVKPAYTGDCIRVAYNVKDCVQLATQMSAQKTKATISEACQVKCHKASLPRKCISRS